MPEGTASHPSVWVMVGESPVEGDWQHSSAGRARKSTPSAARSRTRRVVIERPPPGHSDQRRSHGVSAAPEPPGGDLVSGRWWTPSAAARAWRRRRHRPGTTVEIQAQRTPGTAQRSRRQYRFSERRIVSDVVGMVCPVVHCEQRLTDADHNDCDDRHQHQRSDDQKDDVAVWAYAATSRVTGRSSGGVTLCHGLRSDSSRPLARRSTRSESTADAAGGRAAAGTRTSAGTNQRQRQQQPVPLHHQQEDDRVGSRAPSRR